jgi:hypothetical protein
VTSSDAFQGVDFFGLLASLECGGYLSFVGKRGIEKLDWKVRNFGFDTFPQMIFVLHRLNFASRCPISKQHSRTSECYPPLCVS